MGGYESLRRCYVRVRRGNRAMARGPLTAALLCGCIHGCVRTHDPPSASDAATGTAARVFRDVNLGVIGRAARREMVIRLANGSHSSVRCGEFRTSCDCLSVVANKASIDPSDDALATLRLDLASRPEFVGHLAVEVTAAADDSAEAIRFNVLAEVVPEGELAFCAETAK